MNTIALLMGLLVLAYLGSFLVGERATRGFGLPSGAEYLVLGFVLGPQIFGFVDRTMVDTFQPIAQTANAWLAVIIGLEVGWVGGRRVSVRGFVLGTLFSLATGGIITLAVGVVLFAAGAPKIHVLIIAMGIGAACSETTRHVVRWVVERHDAKGPLSDLIAELADSDDVVPLVTLAVLFSLVPNETAPALSIGSWVAVTIGLGVALGIIAAMLLRGPFREHEAWGVALGTSLLAIGLADVLGLSSLTVAFAMGLSINVLSRHAAAIRSIVEPTERSVMLPALLLAGARVDLSTPLLWVIVLVALFARFGGKMLAGLALDGLAPKGSNTTRTMGAGLMSSGALSIGIGLTIAYRFPGTGDAVLATAAILAVVGEFVGPASLKGSLERAGEIRSEAEA